LPKQRGISNEDRNSNDRNALGKTPRARRLLVSRDPFVGPSRAICSSEGVQGPGDRARTASISADRNVCMERQYRSTRWALPLSPHDGSALLPDLHRGEPVSIRSLRQGAFPEEGIRAVEGLHPFE